MGSVKISLASTDFDLVGIKNLQTRNLKTNLSSEEKLRDFLPQNTQCLT